MLTREDFKTDTWAHIVAFIDARIHELRETNDGPRSEIDTASLRGRIAELKKLKALEPPAPAADGPDEAPRQSTHNWN